MLTLLDRQLVFSFLKAYLVCLVSLISLFVVVDLFTNIDDFTNHKATMEEAISHIALFYSNMVLLIFDRLCEVIVLLAAMFTVAWMQRNNELLPVLSAGVSTRRAVRPVLLAAFAAMGLTVANQELVLPTVDNFILENRSDPLGQRETGVTGTYEANGIHISAASAVRKDLRVRDFFCVIPQKIGGDNLTTIQAKQARYVPPGPGKYTGGWMLTDAQPPEIERWTRDDIVEMIVPGNYFLRTLEVDFERLTRTKNWHMFMPTPQLFQELGKTDSSSLATVAVIFHMRITRPILGLILVFLGLSVILRDQNRNVYISAGLCLVLCGAFFLACFFCKHLGDHGFLTPALAAWLPVLVFGPVSLVMFDAVHT